jgi:hypothetical protein
MDDTEETSLSFDMPTNAIIDTKRLKIKYGMKNQD